jgi:hypothetical protein
MSDHYKRDNLKADFLILLKSEFHMIFSRNIKKALIRQSFLFITPEKLTNISIGAQKL